MQYVHLLAICLSISPVRPYVSWRDVPLSNYQQRHILDFLTMNLFVFSLQFNRDSLKELDCIPGRLLAIVCDGSHGRSASLLGLGDEFAQHSCKAYGAVAAIERQHACSVPTPELRVHNLTFDLDAYDNGCTNDPYPVGFHFKIFGGDRHRYLALAVPKCESGLVKTLKMVLDQAVSIYVCHFKTCVRFIT